MTTCVVRFVREAHPQLFDAAEYPRLSANAEACELLPEFERVVQPITNNL
jgi:glutathione S-transferase